MARDTHNERLAQNRKYSIQKCCKSLIREIVSVKQACYCTEQIAKQVPWSLFGGDREMDPVEVHYQAEKVKVKRPYSQIENLAGGGRANGDYRNPNYLIHGLCDRAHDGICRGAHAF